MKKFRIQSIILAPTRELANQIAQEIRKLSRHIHNVKVLTLCGGVPFKPQAASLFHGAHIIVATPGRILKHIKENNIVLDNVDTLVLDEADKMLDLGFAEELDLILEQLPNKRQNLLFSATYPEKMLKIASRITKEAISIEIEDEEPTVFNITQRVIEVNKENRSPLLQELIRKNKWNQVLVFMASKRASDNLAYKFRKYGFLAESFHGDLIQDDRNYTLDEFKKNKIKILFATDIASRGLHIDDIACVINYDLPRSPADYIHRIGRTGRAGKKGTAISFIGLEDIEHFQLIEKRCEISLEREQLEGFELTGVVVKKEKGKAPIKGKRKSKKDKLREQNNQKS